MITIKAGATCQCISMPALQEQAAPQTAIMTSSVNVVVNAAVMLENKIGSL